ncbi:CGNR zinc finger domain-containing protein [Streptomyces coryli]|uniref:CGNR zinc finger domain-containing protein n=1 Tax=Streptomyces coryli TaxID=1128680 RepID=UPI0030B8FBF3
MNLALRLTRTTRHADGGSGRTETLTSPEALTSWAREQAGLPGYAANPIALTEVLAVRDATRALFAQAVGGKPGLAPADAAGVLNAASVRVPFTLELEPDSVAGEPKPTARRREAPLGTTAGSSAGQAFPDQASSDQASPDQASPDQASPDLAGLAARAAIDLLTGPDRSRLRACPAPRCVQYFLKDAPRQEFCKTACSNRTRAARHYARHRNDSAPAAN